MQEITLYVKLKAKTIDFGGYTTYVFENLNCNDYESKYIMCVQFPNWNQSEIHIDDIGYVNIRYVKEGVSQWFDGEKMQVYKYTNVVFLKFVPEINNVINEIVID